MVEITICPFCLSIFLYENSSGDECPACHIGEVVAIDEYQKRSTEEDTNEQ